MEGEKGKESAGERRENEEKKREKENKRKEVPRVSILIGNFFKYFKMSFLPLLFSKFQNDLNLSF